MRAKLAAVLFMVGACGGGDDTTQPPKDPTTVNTATPKPSASASTPTPTANDRTPEIKKAAAEAYLFGYAAVFMERSKRSSTAASHIPLGTWSHTKALATPSDGSVAPNNDVLFSSAYLDLTGDAFLIKIPDMGTRYFAIQLVDGWSNIFAYIGTRATGPKGGQYLITGPSWKGTVPAGAKEIKSPTNTVWLAGRTRVDSDADIAKVTALFKQWAITPQSGKPPAEPPAPGGRPQDLKFAGPSFFDELGEVLKAEPAPADQKDLLDRIAKVGIGPGLTPSKTLKQEEVAALDAGIKDGQEKLEAAVAALAKKKNGWDMDKSYGRATDGAMRAAYVKRGLDWELSEEAFFPLTQVDEGNQVLSGAHEYVLHFDKDKGPPAQAFWSATVYHGKTGALIDNPGKKYSVGSRSGLKTGKDGSTEIYFSVDAPKTPKENWLPIPKGEAFFVMLRIYQPKGDASTWDLPAIKKVK